MYGFSSLLLLCVFKSYLNADNLFEIEIRTNLSRVPHRSSSFMFATQEPAT